MDKETNPPVPYGENLSGSGLLTKTDRQYLLGQHEPDRERKVRNRLRKRVRTGLRDLALLAQELPARDRRQIFADYTAQIADTDRVYRDDEIDALQHSIAFLAGAAQDVWLPVDELFEEGIRDGYRQTLSDPFGVESVTVTIERADASDIGHLCEKVQEQTELTDTEYRRLLAGLFRDRVNLPEQTADIELDRAYLRERGKRFSRGESVVAVARWSSTKFDAELQDDIDLIHPEVVTDLGLDNMVVYERD